MAPEERVAALMDGLHSILEKAVESQSHWQVLLDASASLWRYSGGNVALLMMQMAQRVPTSPRSWPATRNGSDMGGLFFAVSMLCG